MDMKCCVMEEAKEKQMQFHIFMESFFIELYTLFIQKIHQSGLRLFGPHCIKCLTTACVWQLHGHKIWVVCWTGEMYFKY